MAAARCRHRRIRSLGVAAFKASALCLATNADAADIAKSDDVESQPLVILGAHSWFYSMMLARPSWKAFASPAHRFDSPKHAFNGLGNVCIATWNACSNRLNVLNGLMSIFSNLVTMRTALLSMFSAFLSLRSRRLSLRFSRLSLRSFQSA